MLILIELAEREDRRRRPKRRGSRVEERVRGPLEPYSLMGWGPLRLRE